MLIYSFVDRDARLYQNIAVTNLRCTIEANELLFKKYFDVIKRRLAGGVRKIGQKKLRNLPQEGMQLFPYVEFNFHPPMQAFDGENAPVAVQAYD